MATADNSKNNVKQATNMKHSHKSWIVGIILVVIALFFIAAVGLVVSRAGDDGDSSDTNNAVSDTDDSIEGQNLELSETDAAAEAYFSGEEGATEDSQQALQDIANNDSRTDEERKQALDNLADQCFLANDVVCIEDLLPTYQAGGFDNSFAISLRDDIRALNDEINGIEDRSAADEGDPGLEEDLTQ